MKDCHSLKCCLWNIKNSMVEPQSHSCTTELTTQKISKVLFLIMWEGCGLWKCFSCCWNFISTDLTSLHTGEVFESISKFLIGNKFHTTVHLAWNKRVCCRRAAFHIIFQQKTTLSLKTRIRPMDFVMLPEYHIGKIPPIYSMLVIFTHTSCYASFLHVFRNPSCYFVSD